MHQNSSQTPEGNNLFNSILGKKKLLSGNPCVSLNLYIHYFQIQIPNIKYSESNKKFLFYNPIFLSSTISFVFLMKALMREITFVWHQLFKLQLQKYVYLYSEVIWV